MYRVFVVLMLVIAVFAKADMPSNISSNCPVVYEVTAPELNIRDKPGIPSVVLDTAKKGERVCVYQFVGKWAQTDNGWLSGKYLQRIEQPSGNIGYGQGYQAVQPKVSSSRANLPVVVPTSSQEAAVKADLTGQTAIAVLIVIIAIYLIMLMIGISGKVVVYFDEADLVISLMPWLMLLVAAAVAMIYQPSESSVDPQKMREIQHIVWNIGFVLAAIFAFWAMILSIRYNRSFLVGLPYGIFKLMSVLIGTLVLISQISTMSSEKTKRNQFFFAAMVFGAFIWLGKKLINGKKVYLNHGWTLPK